MVESFNRLKAAPKNSNGVAVNTPRIDSKPQVDTIEGSDPVVEKVTVGFGKPAQGFYYTPADHVIQVNVRFFDTSGKIFLDFFSVFEYFSCVGTHMVG